jgi:MEMO1 family protein
MSQDPESAPSFDPGQPHQQRPRLRRIRGFPAEVEGRKLLGIADARQITDKMVFAPYEAQELLPLLDGRRSVEEVAAEFGRGLPVDQVQAFVAQLDHAGLLEGPVFEAMLARVHADFDATDVLPPAATAAFADVLVGHSLGREPTEDEKSSHAARVLREELDTWIAKALEGSTEPPLTETPRGLIAPHLDYPRGWVAYAAAWGRLRSAPGPDRVLILGTNHFGIGTGVTVCDKGYETALGTCPVDSALLDALKARLGSAAASKALAHRYDHEREHSIELQIPWIQHCLGADGAGKHVPVLGVLIHDPTVNQTESYDGQGLGLSPFVTAITQAMSDVGGRTLVVASADLSHVGPMFGDQIALQGDDPQAKEAKLRVMNHDREMLALVAANQPDQLLAAMSWQQNPTRWCSIGNLIAALKITQPREVRVLRSMFAMDPMGMGIVSCAGGLLL